MGDRNMPGIGYGEAMDRDRLERFGAALDVVVGCMVEAEEFGLPAVARQGDGCLTVVVTYADVTLRPVEDVEALEGNPEPALEPPVGPSEETSVYTTPDPAQMRAPRKAKGGADNLRISPWSPVEDRKALDMAARGSSNAEIAKAVGRPLRGVQQRLRKLRKSKTPMSAAPSRNISQPSDPVKGSAGADDAGGEGQGKAAAADQSGPKGRPEQSPQAKAAAVTATPEGKNAMGSGEAKAAVMRAPEPRPAPARRDGGRDGQANSPDHGQTEPWKPSHLDRRMPTEAEVAQAEADLELLELLAAGNKAGAVAAMLEIDKSQVIARYRELNPEGTTGGQTTAIVEARRVARIGRGGTS